MLRQGLGAGSMGAALVRLQRQASHAKMMSGDAHHATALERVGNRGKVVDEKAGLLRGGMASAERISTNDGLVRPDSARIEAKSLSEDTMT
jgi:hypothetical protein